MNCPTTVECNRKELELMRKQLETKDEVNRVFANEIFNFKLQLVDNRKHSFDCTFEQRKLLSNRNLDKSAVTSLNITVLTKRMREQHQW